MWKWWFRKVFHCYYKIKTTFYVLHAGEESWNGACFSLGNDTVEKYFILIIKNLFMLHAGMEPWLAQWQHVGLSSPIPAACAAS